VYDILDTVCSIYTDSARDCESCLHSEDWQQPPDSMESSNLLQRWCSNAISSSIPHTQTRPYCTSDTLPNKQSVCQCGLVICLPGNPLSQYVPLVMQVQQDPSCSIEGTEGVLTMEGLFWINIVLVPVEPIVASIKYGSRRDQGSSDQI
jgi:hypothetical protein